MILRVRWTCQSLQFVLLIPARAGTSERTFPACRCVLVPEKATYFLASPVTARCLSLSPGWSGAKVLRRFVTLAQLRVDPLRAPWLWPARIGFRTHSIAETQSASAWR